MDWHIFIYIINIYGLWRGLVILKPKYAQFLERIAIGVLDTVLESNLQTSLICNNMK
jgi:hypothetical protein